MKKVLIIEDEELIREVWQYQFEDEGYEVILASSGDEGVELIKTHALDIIITDLKMPQSDGKVVLKYLKENNIKTPTFVCSGFITENESKMINEFNVLKIIKKPFRIDKAFLEIQKLASNC